MVIGVQPVVQSWDVAEPVAATPEPSFDPPSVEEAESLPPPRAGTRAAGAVASLLAAAWLALTIYAALLPGRSSGNGLLDLFAFVSTVASPLALIGVGWLLLRRTSRREAHRFAATAEAMRTEAASMEAVLARLGTTIDANRRTLAEQSALLLGLGEETTERMAGVERLMAARGESLGQHSDALARAAVAARSEMDALMTDLPHAESRSRSFAAVLREAGLDAHQQATALETQVAALAQAGRETDETIGGATQRLATQLGQVETHGAAAARELEQATGTLRDGVDTALAAAAAALAEVRGGLDAQGATMLATVETARAAVNGAGEDAASAFAERLDRMEAHLAALGRVLAERSAGADLMVERLSAGLAGVDAQMAALEETGRERTAAMEQAVGALRGQTERAILAIGDGTVATGQLDEQAAALRATIDAIGREIDSLPPSLDLVDAAAKRSRASVAEAGPETARLEAAARAAADRLARLQASYAEQQAAVDRIGASVTARIADIEAHALALADIEGRFASFGDAGAERTADLAEAIVALSGHAQSIAGTFGASVGEADALTRRITAMEGLLGGIRATLADTLPAALSEVANGAERARDAMARSRPEADALETTIDRAVARLGDVDAAVERKRGEIVTAADAAEERLMRLTAQLDRVHEGLGRAGAEASDVAETAAPRLIEALLRVREAANNAANSARDTLAQVIPAAAARLGDASRAALDDAVSARVDEQIGRIADASGRAVAAAHAATERLERQMTTIADTTAAVEARIEAAQGEIEARDEESFSRRVALLIESLNSTAIDVAEIFAADVDDAAWAAYLRGERGVFTRRAVKLLEGGEQREIARHYEEQPEFRDRVNRYIRDFEAMLRRVLASRDGAPIGVTLLSSDVGKLYVALAQAIERLRT